MDRSNDYQFAIKLQQQLNYIDSEEYENDIDINESLLNTTSNLVHPDWEIIDPTPDVYSLFSTFDQKFFQGKLICVELEWSKKMYSCAGICYQRKNGLGKSCIIRLSEPLLKLRTRRNLIETLLHEMIHAYLFIINIREGNGGHGPNFQRIMTSINTVAGTNITVYHSYHDEVNLYKTHVWRCNGICQNRKPFFGYVRRTNNRAPGPNDLWWRQHQQMCGGYFEKKFQPEPRDQRRKSIDSKINRKKPSMSQPPFEQTLNSPRWGFVGKYSVPTNSKSLTSISSDALTTNLLNNKKNSVQAVSTVMSSNAGNLTNVKGFKDLNSDYSTSNPSTTILKKTITAATTSGGRVLGKPTSSQSNSSNEAQNLLIREIWNKKYPTLKTKPEALPSTSSLSPPSQKRAKFEVKQSSSMWETIDNDLAIENVQPPLVILDDSVDVEMPKPTTNEINRKIKKEIMDSMDTDNDSDIELIDNEFDDDMIETVSLITDTSIIDDLFGEDTLMKPYNEINDAIKNDPENYGRSEREIITCPICQERMAREEIDEHLDGCLGIRINVTTKSKNIIFPSSTPKATSNIQKSINRASVIHSLEEIEYNRRIFDEMNKDRQKAKPILNKDTHTCPVCSKQIEKTQMNEHLDLCLLQNP